MARSGFFERNFHSVLKICTAIHVATLPTTTLLTAEGVPLLFVSIDGLLTASVTAFSQHFTPPTQRLNPVPNLDSDGRFVLSLTLEDRQSDTIYAWRVVSLSPACSRNLADVLEQDLLAHWPGYTAFEQTYNTLSAGLSAAEISQRHRRAPGAAGQ